jgi:hypothetical protein
MKRLLTKLVLTASAALMFMLVGACNNPKESKSEKVLQTEPEKVEAQDVSFNKDLTDMAKLIAGMPVDSSSKMFELTQTKEWKAFSYRMNTNWGKFDAVTNDAINSWVGSEIGDKSGEYSTLFYPFSGPDFINAHIFFPNMQNYVFFGLEAPGTIPQPLSVPRNELQQYFTMYEQSIDHIISLSFFRTLSMKEDLKTKEVDGASPLIYMQMARAGLQIIDVKSFVVNTDGVLKYDSTLLYKKPKDYYKTGIEIKFRRENNPKVHTVQYFSVDVSDMYLEKEENKGAVTWLKNINAPCPVYLKSASYLLHRPYFAIIRDLILEKATFLLQDDSGIPYKYFVNDKWEVSLYGEYTEPIPLFEVRYQEDLWKDYRKYPVKPLNFRRGYNKKSNLLVAKRK